MDTSRPKKIFTKLNMELFKSETFTSPIIKKAKAP